VASGHDLHHLAVTKRIEVRIRPSVSVSGAGGRTITTVPTPQHVDDIPIPQWAVRSSDERKHLPAVATAPGAAGSAVPIQVRVQQAADDIQVATEQRLKATSRQLDVRLGHTPIVPPLDRLRPPLAGSRIGVAVGPMNGRHQGLQVSMRRVLWASGRPTVARRRSSRSGGYGRPATGKLASPLARPGVMSALRLDPRGPVDRGRR